MKMGLSLEQNYSKNIRVNEIPFLISEKLLRDKGLGQIDFAKLVSKNKVILFEIKNRAYPDKKQLRRLIKTQEYISQVLEMVVELKISLCQKTNDSLF